jgi:hypothetical protein
MAVPDLSVMAHAAEFTAVASVDTVEVDLEPDQKLRGALDAIARGFWSPLRHRRGRQH